MVICYAADSCGEGKSRIRQASVSHLPKEPASSLGRCSMSGEASSEFGVAIRSLSMDKPGKPRCSTSEA